MQQQQWNPELATRFSEMRKELLRIGGDCATPDELQHYLHELIGLASAISHSTGHAAWRSLLADGAPLDEWPGSRAVRTGLERPKNDMDHPGMAAHALAVLNVITGAEQLAGLARAAWTTGITEQTRFAVDEARAERARTERAALDELLGGISQTLGALPDNIKRIVATTLADEFARVRQRNAQAVTAEN